jgi:replicative DNA helicase
MMLSGEAIASITDVAIRAEDFYKRAHRLIFEALTGLYAKGEPVDIITTVEELRRRRTLEDAGGALYIHHLVETVGTPASASHYARIVGEHALLRRLISAAGDILQKAYDVPEDPAGFADIAEGLVYAAHRGQDKDEIVALSALVHQSMEDLERLHERTGLVGLPTGFRDLDDLLQGLQKSNLVVVAARPGIGKSSFVTNIARNVAVESGKPVAMFSLEMSRMEIGMRLLCAEARVPSDKVRRAMVAAEDWGRIVEAAETLDRAPIWIVDSGNVTILDIRSKARKLAARTEGLGLIIVDYLQLMTSHQRVESRQQEIAEISRSLKLLAKELDIPVIAVSQLNRDPEKRTDKRPQLADLRECVTGDTLVSLTDGRRVPIRQLVGTTPEVWAVSSEGRIVAARSDLVWKVGRREVFEVRLASGRRIRATAKHRLLGFDGWARVENLRAGDRLALGRRIPEPTEPLLWPDSDVALLGQLVGDGSYLSNQPIRYATASEENSELVVKAVRAFGSTAKRYRGRGKWHQLLITGNGNRWHPAGVNKWLRDLGIFGQRSFEKRLPEEVFRLSNRQVKLLLRHLWATDGCIYTRPSGRGSDAVFFATSSPTLASDVLALLVRLGIVGRVRTTSKKGYRPVYSVHVSGGRDQAHFLRSVGGFGPREEQAERLKSVLATRTWNSNVDTVPQPVFERVLEVMAERGITHRQMAGMRGTAYGGSSHFAFSPSREVVAGYAQLLDDEILQTHASAELFWDRVVDVEPVGEEDVFDLTVPGPASWLADSIVSHNSGAIEQDSDVVMFIHREDVYNRDDPAVKGVADVIVAKHRNGPTDNVRLTFRGDLTQFLNYTSGQ